MEDTVEHQTATPRPTRGRMLTWAAITVAFIALSAWVAAYTNGQSLAADRVDADAREAATNARKEQSRRAEAARKRAMQAAYDAYWADASKLRDEIEKLQAATETGIVYANYIQRIADTNYFVKRFREKYEETLFCDTQSYKALLFTFAYYVQAQAVWKTEADIPWRMDEAEREQQKKTIEKRLQNAWTKADQWFEFGKKALAAKDGPEVSHALPTVMNDIAGDVTESPRHSAEGERGGDRAPATYLLADSGRRPLTASDLDGSSARDLCLMRNEIFARHGRPFQEPQIRAWFVSRPWYHANPSYSDAMLTALEQRNAQFILSYQDAHNKHWPW